MRIPALARRVLMSTAAMILTIPAAFAQTAAQTSGEEIVVTGTRIKSGAIQAPQPIQVLTAAQLAQRGQTSLADALDKIPALQASTSVEQSIRDSAVTGRVSLNLRGLGTARTLVLVNGRRHVSGSPGTAAVDVSSIPSALVERVDVLTGGASAVYGSDAVTGVVNFVLKQNYEGQQFDAQFSAAGKGDAPALFASYLGGFNFGGGKGNVTLAVQVDSRKGVQYADRPQFANNNLPITDNIPNPAFRFQNGDPLPPGVTPFQAVGQTILLASGAPRFADTPSALLDRAKTATPLFLGRKSVFAISANQGLIGFDPFGAGFSATPGDLSTAPDVDGDGVNDCVASNIGRRGFGCWVVDRASGNVRAFRDGIIASTVYQFGGDGAEQYTDGDSLTPDTTSVAINLNGNYEFSKRARLYVEAKAVENRAKELNYYNTFDDAIQFKLDNPFIPAALRTAALAEIAAQQDADPTYDPSTFQILMARDNIDVFDPRSRNTRRTYRGVVGLDGQLSPTWSYDLSVNYGRTEQHVFSPTRLRDRFFAAADAVIDPATGRPACRIAVTGALPNASGLDPDAFSPVPAVTFQPNDCRPLNLFGLNLATQDARTFQRFIAESKATIEQTVVQGIVTGDTSDFFKLQGGPIGIAAGLEYRKEKSDFTPDPVNQNGLAWEKRTVSAVTGAFDVKEAFAEIRVPLLADLPFAKILTLNAAYRAGDYSTVGQTSSYKFDGVYAPFSDLRIRGGYSRTVRAPNISELFLAPQSVNTNPRDPCLQSNITLGPSPANRLANCSTALGLDLAAAGFTNQRTSQFAGTRQGNANLQEETSDSWTAGMVLQPRFLKGFTATVDYWNIKIDNAISTIDADQIVANCYDAPSLNNQYCALFARDLGPAKTSPNYGLINRITIQELNFARFEAAGVDFDVNYVFGLKALGLPPKSGDLTLNLSGTYLEKRDDFPFASEPNRADRAKLELNFPEWNATASATWSVGDVSLAWFANYQSKQALRSVEIDTVKDWTPNFAPESWVHDAALTWTPSNALKLIAGVNNIFEEDAFLTETSLPASALGRTIFLRVQSKF